MAAKKEGKREEMPFWLLIFHVLIWQTRPLSSAVIWV